AARDQRDAPPRGREPDGQPRALALSPDRARAKIALRAPRAHLVKVRRVAHEHVRRGGHRARLPRQKRRVARPQSDDAQAAAHVRSPPTRHSATVARAPRRFGTTSTPPAARNAAASHTEGVPTCVATTAEGWGTATAANSAAEYPLRGSAWRSA